MPTRKSSWACWQAALAVILGLLLPAKDVAAATASTDDLSTQPSEIMPRASHALLLDVVHTSAGFVAIGERGHVLVSPDGKHWTQVQVPTRSTLTCITAFAEHLWAAGHDGVILHSRDGGKHWQAQRSDPFNVDAANDLATSNPRQGVPILDIMFSDAKNGLAIGAYNLLLTTHDGGATWLEGQAIAAQVALAEEPSAMQGDVFSDADLELGDESDPHLNGITRMGDLTRIIVGERGTLLRSTDAGASWEKLAFPYRGSMFGVLWLGEQNLLAYGLRGNVYESMDAGDNWQKVETGVSVNLMGGVSLQDGGVVLVGSNGTVLSRSRFGESFVTNLFRNSIGETPSLAGAVLAAKNEIVLVGDKGVDVFHLK